MQTFFLPPTSIRRTGHLEVSGFYRPAEQCGGDWWWHEENEGSLLMLVGDVTGHGAAAAMVTASVATAYRFGRRLGHGEDVGELLMKINAELLNTCGGQFHMSLAVLQLSAESGHLRVYNAGAPASWLVRAPCLGATTSPLRASRRC